MIGFEYDPNATIGERPLNLNPEFVDNYANGSIAGQLHNAGYYKGLEQAYKLLEGAFSAQPDVLSQISELFFCYDASEDNA